MFLHLSILWTAVSLGAYIIECTPTKKEENPIKLIKRYHLECIAQTRVDYDIIANIKNGDWSIPQDQKQLVKDWSLCVLMKVGVMTAQGVYRMDVALRRVQPEDRDVVEDLIDQCLSKKPIPAPDIAFNFLKCYQHAASNH